MNSRFTGFKMNRPPTLEIKDVQIVPVDFIGPVRDIQRIPGILVKALAKGKISAVHEVEFPFRWDVETWSDIPTKMLASPDRKVVIKFRPGRGFVPVYEGKAGVTYLILEDMFYRRISFLDLGKRNAQKGLKSYRGGKTIWYLIKAGNLNSSSRKDELVNMVGSTI